MEAVFGRRGSGIVESAQDGSWAKVLTGLLAKDNAVGTIDWEAAVDSTIVRAHQHATTLPRHTGALSNHKIC